MCESVSQRESVCVCVRECVQVPGLGISTGMFPFRAVELNETLAGMPSTVTLRFSTTGYIPTDGLIRLVVPRGIDLSLPFETDVVRVRARACS